MKKLNLFHALYFFAFFAISINAYSQNLQKYQDGFLWGYKDSKTQKVVIKAKYGFAEDFKDGLATVSEGVRTSNQRAKLKIINSKGLYIVDTSFEKIINIGKGLVVVGITDDYSNFLFGILDKTGKILLPNEYSKISEISEGFIVVSNREKQYGVIDLTGNFVIQLQSDFVIWDLKCDVWKIKKNYSYGFMDKTGKVLIDPSNSGFTDMSAFNKFCITEIRKGNLYGLINSSGKIIVEPVYSRSSGLKDNGVTYYKDKLEVKFDGNGKKK